MSASDLAVEFLADGGGPARLAQAVAEEMAAHVAWAARLLHSWRRCIWSGRAKDVAPAARGPLQGAWRAGKCLVADSANRLQRTVVVPEETIDRSLVPVRETSNAVRASAIAHNRPSGGATQPIAMQPPR